jgi:pimeloyl-ACP methyl ester carboxylesterase
MKRIYFLTLLLLLAMTSSVFSQAGKTYILVHGAWHGAWCWYKVVPLLEAKGNKVIAFDLPGHGDDTTKPENVTLADYVNKLVSIANAQKGPVILVGHSMAGIVISQAAEELGVNKVSALIYLDAFLPANGESLFSLVEMVLKQLPPDTSQYPSLIESIIPSPDHQTNFIKPVTAEWIFYHDCSEDDKKFAIARISKQPIAPLATPVHLTDSIYGSIPKYYILCTEGKDLDKTFLSTHVLCKKVYKVASSHSPFLSMPEKLVEILSEINGLIALEK